jgi:hypothetical protein
MAVERNKGGQFKKGNSGNPKGRAPRKKEERFMEVSIAAVSLKDWRAIIKKAVTRAKAGDTQARKFLADYLLGPPQQRLDVTSGGEVLKGYIGISPDDWDNVED